jgi:MIP family channel proteins
VSVTATGDGSAAVTAGDQEHDGRGRITGKIELESRDPLRRAAAELVGAFLLTLVAAGAEMMSKRSPVDVSAGAKAVAPGLVVTAMVYAVSDVSGAHFNPAVTLAFAARGDFRWRFVPLYWAAQLTGAVAAASVLRWMLGDIANLGAVEPKVGNAVAIATEMILTAMLVTVVLGTATRPGAVGPNSALAVGATIVLAGLVFGPLSGPSMNPARSLGPALVARHLTHVWVYLVGPTAGALVGVAVVWLVHGPREPEERVAAEGEQAST